MADIEELVESLMELKNSEVTLLLSMGIECESAEDYKDHLCRVKGKLIRVRAGIWEVAGAAPNYIRFKREDITSIDVKSNLIKIRW